MTTADELLEMIISVDPLNTKEMEKINIKFTEFCNVHPKPLVNYAGSRDMLKKKRPEGWFFEVTQLEKDRFIAILTKEHCFVFEGKTEELAEMGVIVKTMDFIRRILT